MNPVLRSLLLASALILPTTTPMADTPQPITWQQLQKLPLPAVGGLVTYGERPQQFGELRLPQGSGPFPVFVLVHGGCWLNEFDYVYITRLADWLTTQGYAVWTIEYARLGDEAGGWPGTFIDVARGADALQGLAKLAPLDLDHVYAAGHSAGGQLALWLASRSHLPSTSPLYIPDPLQIRGVLGLAAITDLDEYRKGPVGSCHASVETLLGGGPESVEARYAETSPLRRLPLGVRQVLIQGEKDAIVDPQSVRDYVSAANNAGDTARYLSLPTGGHFDTVAVTPLSEPVLREALRQLSAP